MGWVNFGGTAWGTKSGQTSSSSYASRITDTAAVFIETLICSKCSRENLQFLNWVLASKRGFLVALATTLDGDGFGGLTAMIAA